MKGFMKDKLKRYGLMLAGFIVGGVIVVVVVAGMAVGSIAGIAYVGAREGFVRSVDALTRDIDRRRRP